jgi:flagellar motor protein MotB
MNYSEDDSLIDFNFWPSFADTLLAVVLVFLIVLGVVGILLHTRIDIRSIIESQNRLTESIAVSSGFDLVEQSGDTHRLCNAVGCPIEITTDLQMQRITFSDRLLFQPDQFLLMPEGRRVLGIVGEAIKDNADIHEIQIQGHTDDIPTSTYSGGNMELGARRGLSVFEFLRSNIGIDPQSRLMSVTSYGEFRPVSDKRAQNRRVEILLFYHRRSDT